MSGVEVIAAALAAGAGAGVTDTASAAVRDAYASLKDLLRHRLGDRAEVVDTDDARPDVWLAVLRDALAGAEIGHDDPVLVAARRLLDLSGPAKTFDIDVNANYGAVGDFAAPVTFNQGIPVPPPAPTAATGHRLSAAPTTPASPSAAHTGR